MKSAARIMAVACMVSLALPVAAQRTGTRIGRTIPSTKPELIFDAMSKCYVNSYTEKAQRFLATIPGSPEEASVANSMVDALEVCLNDPKLVFQGSGIYLEPDGLRRSLSTALVRKQSEKLPAAAPAGEVNRVWSADEIRSAGGFSSGTIAVVGYSQCVALTDWASARRLVLAQPESKDAKAAIKAIKPAFDSCLDSRTPIKIDQKLLAHVVGQGIYYLSLKSGGA